MLAQEEARILGHCYLGTEHLLMGLLDEGSGPAYLQLTLRGIDRSAVHIATGELVGVGKTLTGRFVALTPRARQVFDRARVDMESAGARAVEPEHLLSHLFDDRRSVAARVVDRLATTNGHSGHRSLAPPSCARCRAPLEHNTLTAIATWSHGSARVLYCAGCGQTFGVLPLEPEIGGNTPLASRT